MTTKSERRMFEPGDHYVELIGVYYRPPDGFTDLLVFRFKITQSDSMELGSTAEYAYSLSNRLVVGIVTVPALERLLNIVKRKEVTEFVTKYFLTPANEKDQIEGQFGPLLVRVFDKQLKRKEGVIPTSLRSVSFLSSLQAVK